MSHTIRIRVSQGLPGPPGTATGETYTGFTFWPRQITTQITIPDNHTMPVRDIELAGDDAEIVIGTNSELLVL